MEIGRWVYTGISWVFGPRGANGRHSGKKSQVGSGREQEKVVRGKSSSPNPPGRASTVFSEKISLS